MDGFQSFFNVSFDTLKRCKVPAPAVGPSALLDSIKNIKEFPKIGYVAEVVGDTFSVSHPDLPDNVAVQSGSQASLYLVFL